MLTRAQAVELRREAEMTERVGGWYHDNMLTDVGNSRVVVRVPRWDSGFDPEPRMYSEWSVLAALKGMDLPVSEATYGSSDLQIHKFISGLPLEEVYPTGSVLPESVDREIARIESAAWHAMSGRLRLLPVNQRFYAKRYSRSQGFAVRLSSWLSFVYRSAAPVARQALLEVGVRIDPFVAGRPLADGSRSLRLCHGDLSRGNCLWGSGGLSVIDWELAVRGDPAWDLASYLHRFGFEERQEAAVIDARLRLIPRDQRAKFRSDVDGYRAQEVDRSIVIDCIRLCTAWGSYEARRIDEYLVKVAQLRPGGPPESGTSARLVDLLDRAGIAK